MVVYTPYITLKDGSRIYAKNYGKRVFRFETSNKKKRKKK